MTPNPRTVPNACCSTGKTAHRLCLLAACLLLVCPGYAQTTEKPSDTKQNVTLVAVVEGQVTDAIGSGQSDVAVTLFGKADDGTRGASLADVTTNEYGDFKLELPQRTTGAFVVVFQKKYHLDAVHELTLAKEGVIPFIAQSFEGNIKLSGRVVSAADGKAVVGAKIALETDGRDHSATSNKKGVFEIRGIAPGGAILVIEAKGFGRERQHIAQTQKSDKLTITLKPERLVQFAVMDDAGDEVSGATVEVLDQARNDMRSAITDADGLATFRGIHFDAHKLRVRLSHDQYVSSPNFTKSVELPKDQAESEHQLFMQRAGTIRATVIDANTKKPVYGARVMTGDWYSDVSPRDWTDDVGVAEISGVAPGGTITTVHAAGYAPTLWTVVAEIGKTVEHKFALEKGVTIHGRLDDSRGNPIPGAEIKAGQWRGFRTLGLRAMTDAKGEFVMEDAPEDKFGITIEAPGAIRAMQSLQASATTSVLTLDYAILKLMAKERKKSERLKAGDPAPPITLTTIAKKKINLAQWRGKVVVLDFWATWCAPCIEELPLLTKIYEQYKDRRDFALIGISRDFAEADVRSFLRNNKQIVWDQAVGEDGGADNATKKFGVLGIPAIIVIGADGKIAATDLNTSQLDARLTLLLKPKG